MDTSNWQTYRSDEFGFEVKYPKDWELVEDLGDDNGVNIYGPGLTSEFSVIEIRNPESWTLDQYVKTLDPYPQTLQEKANVNLVPIVHNEARGYQYINLRELNSDTSLELFLADSRNRFWDIIGYSGKIGDVRILDQILATFRFVE